MGGNRLATRRAPEVRHTASLHRTRLAAGCSPGVTWEAGAGGRGEQLQGRPASSPRGTTAPTGTAGGQSSRQGQRGHGSLRCLYHPDPWAPGGETLCWQEPWQRAGDGLHGPGPPPSTHSSGHTQSTQDAAGNHRHQQLCGLWFPPPSPAPRGAAGAGLEGAPSQCLRLRF